MSNANATSFGTIQRSTMRPRPTLNNGFTTLEHSHGTLRSLNSTRMNGGLMQSQQDFPNGHTTAVTTLGNSETDPDSWSCSQQSRDTSPESSSIPPGMPAFRVIPLVNPEPADQYEPYCSDPPPEWETEPLRASSAQPQPPPSGLQNSTQQSSGQQQPMLRKNQYWV